MSDIEWTEKTWNPMVGCTPVVTRDEHGQRVPSGCDHCYAEGQVHRFGKRYDRDTTIKVGAKARTGLTFLPTDPATGKALGKGAKWTGAVWLLPDVLDEPLRRRKPTTYFVNSLSDVFHESVVGCEEGRRFVAAMFGVMAACPQHTFQILSKRPERAREWFAWLGSECPRQGRAATDLGRFQTVVDTARTVPSIRRLPDRHRDILREASMQCRYVGAWPLPNVWMLTSISTQADADQRIPELLAIPAAMHGVSAEPMLGPITLAPEWVGGYPESDEWARTGSHVPRLRWLIAGGESGPKARPCEIEWLRSLVGQCRDAGVACFVKQLGSRPVFSPGAAPDILDDAKGGDMAEWPADLRVREMPR